MNKAELISAVSEALNGKVSKKDIGDVIAATTDAITAAVKAGDRVSLIGFGSFDATKRPERTGRNPANGKELLIPAKTLPRFKSGQAFKDALN